MQPAPARQEAIDRRVNIGSAEAGPLPVEWAEIYDPTASTITSSTHWCHDECMLRQKRFRNRIDFA